MRLERVTIFNVPAAILALLATLFASVAPEAQAYTYDEAAAKKILYGLTGTGGRAFDSTKAVNSYAVFPETMNEADILAIVKNALEDDEDWEESEMDRRRRGKTVEVDNLSVYIEVQHKPEKILDFYPVGGYWKSTDTVWANYAKSLPSMKIGVARIYHCSDFCPSMLEGWHTDKGTLINTDNVSKKARKSSDLTFHIYDVGAGNCIIAECPAASGENNAIILDCGVSKAQLSSIVKPSATFGGKAPLMLEDMYDILAKKDKIDLILTHPDIDHYNLIPYLFYSKKKTETENAIAPKLRSIYVGGLWTDYKDSALSVEAGAPAPKRRKTGGAKVHEVLGKISDGTILASKPAVHAMINANDVYKNSSFTARSFKGNENLACGDAAKILAYNAYPNRIGKEKGEESNGQSIIVAFQHGGKRIALTGDATDVGLRNAITNDATTGYLNGVDVLVVPHHGSRLPTHFPAEWMDTVKPKRLIFSAGGKFDHPTQEAYDYYKDEGTLLAAAPHAVTLSNATINVSTATYSTFDDGDIVVNVPGDTGSVDTYCVGPWGTLDALSLVSWCSPDL